MCGGRDEIGSWCHPTADRRWVPLLLLASRLSFYPRHWRDWRSSVKSRCEPPINGAVVEIVAYLKNEMEKGAFSPFSSRRFISLATEEVFYFLETNRREKKRTEEKLFSTSSFLSFSFLSFSTHTGLVSSLIMLDAVKSGDAKKLAGLIRQDPGVKVNMDHGDGNTLLHFACRDSSRSAVIPLLLPGTS